jgi:hypothetical protein
VSVHEHEKTDEDEEHGNDADLFEDVGCDDHSVYGGLVL